MDRDSFTYSLPYICIATSMISIPPSGTFITINKPTLTHHNHSSPQFTLQFTLAFVHSMSLDECIVTCTCH